MRIFKNYLTPNHEKNKLLQTLIKKLEKVHKFFNITPNITPITLK